MNDARDMWQPPAYRPREIVLEGRQKSFERSSAYSVLIDGVRVYLPQRLFEVFGRLCLWRLRNHHSNGWVSVQELYRPQHLAKHMVWRMRGLMRRLPTKYPPDEPVITMRLLDLARWDVCENNQKHHTYRLLVDERYVLRFSSKLAGFPDLQLLDQIEQFRRTYSHMRLTNVHNN